MGKLTAYVLVLAILNSLKVGSMNGGDGKWDACLCDGYFSPLGDQKHETINCLSGTHHSSQMGSKLHVISKDYSIFCLVT